MPIFPGLVKTKAELEAKHGKVWTTSEMQDEFDALGFMAPFIIIRKRDTGERGSLMFTHSLASTSASNLSDSHQTKGAIDKFDRPFFHAPTNTRLSVVVNNNTQPENSNDMVLVTH